MSAHKTPDIEILHLLTEGEVREVSPNCIGVCASCDPAFVLSQAMKHGLNHIVQRDSLAYDSEIEFSREMIKTPEHFANFPISAILTPGSEDTASETALTLARLKCSSRNEINEAVDVMAEALQAQVNRGVLDDIRLAMTELLSNAVFHGPLNEFKELSYDEHGREIHRLRPIAIRPSFISVGMDEERIVVAVRDLYGGLNVTELLKRVYHCFEFGLGSTINFDEGGAGIGVYMLFKLAVGIYISVSDGGQTVVAATFVRRGGMNRRESVPKNLHIWSSVKKNAIVPSEAL